MLLTIQGCLLGQGKDDQGCLLGQGKDDHGEVSGVPGRVGWKMEVPAGMVFIPGGSFTIGSVDQDAASRVNPHGR